MSQAETPQKHSTVAGYLGGVIAARSGRVGPRIDGFFERHATKRNLLILLALAAAIALIVFFVRPVYPNYDSYYTLLWALDITNGKMPNYDVVRPPTPHPLSTLLSVLISGMGTGSARFLVLLTLLSFVGLLGFIFRFTQLLLGPAIALVAVAVVLTRTDLELFTLRAMIDISFLAFIFAAAVFEIQRPKRGWLPLVLLTLAGLLRPEAWLLTAAYVVYLWPAYDRKTWFKLALLAASAPVIWFAYDLIVTGNPLFSLTSTRGVAAEFGRQRGVFDAISLIPDYAGANEKIVNVFVGGLGLLLALKLIGWRKAVVPIALGVLGLATFMAISVAGLSVIPRYLLVPSLLLNLGVAVALLGWIRVSSDRLRTYAVLLAALTVLIGVWRAPSYERDLRKLNGQTTFVVRQHDELRAILNQPSVIPLIQNCRPITTPTHSAVPVVRYYTGLPSSALNVSYTLRKPPERGVLLIAKTFNFEPAAARTTVTTNTKSARKWFSNRVLPGFEFVASNQRWRVYKKDC